MLQINSSEHHSLKRKRSRTRSSSPTKDPSPRRVGDSSSAVIADGSNLVLVSLNGASVKCTAAGAMNKRPRLLRIEIPPALNSVPGHSSPRKSEEDEEDETNSLFSENSTIGSLFGDVDGKYTLDPLVNDIAGANDDDETLASRETPPIPGLYLDPSLLIPQELADAVFSFCMKTYFTSPTDNQVMLFGRYIPSSSSQTTSGQSGFPPILITLLSKISSLLQPVVPPSTYKLLFPDQPSQARQAIINLYQPGEGITPHIDLLGRYGDGIIGVSFSSGSVMRFDKVEYPQEQATVNLTEGQHDNHVHKHEDTRTRWDIYLPERTIIVLSEEARYKWTHGIDKKQRDFIISEPSSFSPPSSACPTGGKAGGEWIDRGIRMSVTFRWLLPGADVVGDALVPMKFQKGLEVAH